MKNKFINKKTDTFSFVVRFFFVNRQIIQMSDALYFHSSQ